MEKTRTIFFIDGFNLYHSIANPKYEKFKWLNYYQLASHFTNKFESLEDVYYFTALAKWSDEKVKKHKTFIKALETYGVKTIYGQFQKKRKQCRICKQFFETFEEKKTDVNIAIYLLKLAQQDRYEKAFVISGDSDLIPAIEAVKELFPKKEVHVVIPVGGKAFGLKSICDGHIQMKGKHLAENQLPQKIILSDKSYIECPPAWK